MEVILNSDEVEKLEELITGDFGSTTCFDYIDSLIKDSDKFGVVVFVEPAGNVIKWGNSWVEVLDWWIEVFKLQPNDWHKNKAGWHIYYLKELSDDPKTVWIENTEHPK